MYPTNQEKFSSTSSPTPVFHSSPATGVPVNPSHQHTYYANPQYPYPHHRGHHASSAWSSGLCGCCSDVKNCCLTCWCPCITFGRIAEIVDKGETSCGVSGAIYGILCCFTSCGCLYSCLYRSKLRRQYELKETPCNDCLVHCCCESCALCQEYRELESRGFDLAMGWRENMERQNRGVAMAAPTAPVFEGVMNR